MHLCYEVRLTQNLDYSIQKPASIYVGKLMRRLVCLVIHAGTKCHFASVSSNDTCQGERYNTSKCLSSFPTLGSDRVSFLFRVLN
jgi:hypothetical protein